LSGGELLNIAENDNKQKQNRFRDVVFGLLDVSAVLFFFVPFFAERGEAIESVNLLSLSVSPYLKTAYFVLIIAVILLGVLTLIYGGAFAKYKNIFSIILTAILLLLFILNLQPYAATLVFAFLLIKALILKVSRV
jgi:hypothetical protein